MRERRSRSTLLDVARAVGYFRIRNYGGVALDDAPVVHSPRRMVPEATGSAEAPVAARGIRPSELAARVRTCNHSLNAVEMTKWLTREKLATLDDDGLLRPTPRVFDLVWPGA